MLLLATGCRLCGSTTYRRLRVLDAEGAPATLFQCSSCSVMFADPRAWVGQQEPSVAPLPLPPSRGHFHVHEGTPAAPDLGSYGINPASPAGVKR